MKLQNINFDYTNATISSFADEQVYILEPAQIMDDFIESINNDYSVTANKLIVQITLDQNLSEPRIVINADTGDVMFESLRNLEINFPSTYDQYLLLQEEVLAQISEQNKQTNDETDFTRNRI